MHPDRLLVSETFVSRQGEGSLTGTESFFIRLSGCNLRCWFCDTPYASWYPEGESQMVDQLVQAVIDSRVTHVVLTGGEPLLPQAVGGLLERLATAGLHVTVETAGTVFRDAPIDLVSISPKLASSGPAWADASAAAKVATDSARYSAPQLQRWQQRHERTRWRPDVISDLISRASDHQVKFVVHNEEEWQQAERAADQLGVAANKVWIMPQGITAEELDSKGGWLRSRCDQRGFQFCDRLHIRWYGNRRGT